jgi:hypothetical protein
MVSLTRGKRYVHKNYCRKFFAFWKRINRTIIAHVNPCGSKKNLKLKNLNHKGNRRKYKWVVLEFSKGRCL